MLFALAENIPTTASDVIGYCSPVPPLVRMYASDIAYLLQNISEEADKVIASKTSKVMEQMKGNQAASASNVVVVDSVGEDDGSAMMDLDQLSFADVSALVAKKSMLFGDQMVHWGANTVVVSEQVKAIHARIPTSLFDHLPDFEFVSANENEWKKAKYN
jgi:hypothetical protein